MKLQPHRAVLGLGSGSAGVSRSGRLIRLTPLIDMVFILLVFFMLASSFLEWRTIVLQPPQQARPGGPMEGAYLVEVNADGLRLSGQAISPQTLEERARAWADMRPARPVLVKPGAGVALQEAVRVIDLLASAGITDMSFLRTANHEP